MAVGVDQRILRRRIRRAQRRLVVDQGAVRGAGAIDARLEAGLPEHLVAAEEREVDAGIARGLDAAALIAGPVFVVADREKGFRLARSGVIGASAIGVDAGPGLDVVAIRL